MPLLVAVGIPKDELSLLLSAVLVFLSVTNMWTRKGREATTSRKCLAWEAVRMVKSLQISHPRSHVIKRGSYSEEAV